MEMLQDLRMTLSNLFQQKLTPLTPKQQIMPKTLLSSIVCMSSNLAANVIIVQVHVYAAGRCISCYCDMLEN